jgi:hypothetical protein
MVNGGFPPIKYKNSEKKETSKERFFSNVSKTNLNIRQILISDINKKSFIDINEKNNDELEVIDKL